MESTNTNTQEGFIGFKIPKEYRRPDPVVSFDGTEVDVDSIPDKSISFDFYNETMIRANTPGFNKLIPKYDTQTLIHKVRDNILPNCSRHDTITYDGALQEEYVPELLSRLEELTKENALLQAYVNFADARTQLHADALHKQGGLLNE